MATDRDFSAIQSEPSTRSPTQLRLTFVPPIESLTANPYWTILKNGLVDAGAQYVSPDDERFLRWLWRTRHESKVVHIHFVQHLYAFRGDRARLRWVLRLVRNMVLIRILGHRTVFTLHNLSPSNELAPRWVEHLAQRSAAVLANAVIVHCHTARRLLTKTYGRRRGVYVVPHPNFIGVYPDTIRRQDARASFGYVDDDLVLLFVGEFRTSKGVEGLLRAVRQCDDRHIRLLLAGAKGQSREYCDGIWALASADARIRLDYGRIADADMQRYYRACDIVVLPFARVLTSSSVMLAMSFGCGVVVPDLGCLSELPEKVAIRYTPGREDELVQVLRLLRTRDLAQMGRDARAWVKSYTQERFVCETMRVYRSV